MKARTIFSTATLLTLGAAGCAARTPAPVELTNARVEVARAQHGPASQLDPAGVHEAQVALANAEKAWSDAPEDPNTIDLAVIAQVRAEIAESHASTLQG